MNELSETQSKLDELMNEYEVAVIGENRGRNRSGYSEKADKYYQKRRELKEFVAELEAERHWIPVSERLPEGEKVLVLWKDGAIHLDWTFIDGGSYYWWNSGQANVTHWMPLPEPPEVQK